MSSEQAMRAALILSNAAEDARRAGDNLRSILEDIKIAGSFLDGIKQELKELLDPAYGGTAQLLIDKITELIERDIK